MARVKMTLSEWTDATRDLPQHSQRFKQLYGPSPGGCEEYWPALTRTNVHSQLSRGALDAVDVYNDFGSAEDPLFTMITVASLEEYAKRQERRHRPKGKPRAAPAAKGSNKRAHA